jgi:hypothetical protein
MDGVLGHHTKVIIGLEKKNCPAKNVSDVQYLPVVSTLAKLLLPYSEHFSALSGRSDLGDGCENPPLLC